MSENDRVIEFPGIRYGIDPAGVIVVMGLPCTHEGDVAGVIARWAGCPVLLTDDFLDPISDEAGYNVNSLPSEAEAERLHRLAFDTLCSVAKRYLRVSFSGCKGVVIKSRICSTYELQRLIDLISERFGRYVHVKCPVVFVECKLRNKYRWEEKFSDSVRKWYGPRNWKDVEKAKDDYDPQAWDHQLHQLLPHHHFPRVKRLVVDPDYDLSYTVYEERINPTLANAIKFLLTADHEELTRIPRAVGFGQLRLYLMVKKIKRALASRERSKYVCAGGGCVFKYWESPNTGCCGVCEERVVSGYNCYFCGLTLHKSCAEMPYFNPPPFPGVDEDSTLEYHTHDSPRKRKCKSCIDGNLPKKLYGGIDDACTSCHFETHLKSRFMPTIISKPDFHDHMVSLNMIEFSRYFSCKACGLDRWFQNFQCIIKSRYGCNICETYYHPDCVFSPRELDHKHGGHEHVMKLMFSHDGAEEEGYWCEICYKDIDPEVWFYSCRGCPCYVAHLHCALGVRGF